MRVYIFIPALLLVITAVLLLARIRLPDDCELNKLGSAEGVIRWAPPRFDTEGNELGMDDLKAHEIYVVKTDAAGNVVESSSHLITTVSQPGTCHTLDKQYLGKQIAVVAVGSDNTKSAYSRVKAFPKPPLTITSTQAAGE